MFVIRPLRLMKPLRVALVVKASGSTIERDARNMGYWSYPVPEFEWQHFVFDGKEVQAGELNDFDIVIQEDSGPTRYYNLKKPLAFVAIDSTLSLDHLAIRRARSRQANLILVDHDRPENFQLWSVPVRRLNYCINDRLMKDYGEQRSVDISFHCGGSPERTKLRQMLHTYCQENGITFRSGTMGASEYAQAMARSKIVVNWPRTPSNRPHRVFDSMACGACLVTGPLPDVSGDERIAGRDYIQVDWQEQIPPTVKELLDSGKWQEIAFQGHKLVMKYHTWATRARQLRVIIKEELGL